ncbi:iron-sulfur cluster biosynthesis family protein [Ammoniphilus sp. YIM 78166]|uniref:iron-sulfur cluster biosynthesis family protein n=1 Tax=Ammoniphilus sp. YIM 78166 TaxID=1644106 RepID=UPI00106F948F|nr:iron-sulfur cluster biosynthesis family protein [Ammoniphilus sp. YIM 78166]
MKLRITEAAQFELQKLTIPEGMAVRLDADLSGCCTWNFTVKLILDEQRRNDSSLTEGNVPFFIDHFTKRYLGEDLLLDFEASTGFSIKSDEDVFACESSGIYQLTT